VMRDVMRILLTNWSKRVDLSNRRGFLANQGSLNITRV
jgi:hypothetical protein